MKTIQAFFLTAKHWQIFVLLFVVPTIASFAAIITMQNTFFIAVTVAYAFCLLAWYWSLGAFLSSKVTTQIQLKLSVFRFAIVYPLLYIPVFFWFAMTPGNGGVAIVVPLHLLGMVCMMYVLYFVSRNWVMAETGKPASFAEYIGPLFLFWFFPIGVWVVQPKMNRLYGRGAEVSG